MTAAETVFPPDTLALREVGLRDGLQMVERFPTTDGKRRWLAAEYAAGVRHFEVGSFLPAGRYPQFADVREVIDTVGALPGAHGMALVLNEKGALAALESGVGEVGCVVSATEEHSQRNARRSRQDAVDVIEQVCRLRDASDHKPLVSAGIAMAFGCSIAGKVAEGDVLSLIENCLEAGADIVSLGDTVGYAGPDQIAGLVRAARNLTDARPLGVHLHDTRGLGLANASAALDEGVRLLDGALGGLGGCPFAPRATGNIVFEDLVYLCESKGFDTGIDIDQLVAVRAIIAEEMPGEDLIGAIAQAGLPLAYPFPRTVSAGQSSHIAS